MNADDMAQFPYGPDARVVVDLPCVTCRYNLRTLPAEGRCPECGTAVDDTRSYALVCADQRWVRRLLGGVRLVLWMIGVCVVLGCLGGGIAMFVGARTVAASARLRATATQPGATTVPFTFSTTSQSVPGSGFSSVAVGPFGMRAPGSSEPSPGLTAVMSAISIATGLLLVWAVHRLTSRNPAGQMACRLWTGWAVYTAAWVQVGLHALSFVLVLVVPLATLASLSVAGMIPGWLAGGVLIVCGPLVLGDVMSRVPHTTLRKLGSVAAIIGAVIQVIAIVSMVLALKVLSSRTPLPAARALPLLVAASCVIGVVWLTYAVLVLTQVIWSERVLAGTVRTAELLRQQHAEFVGVQPA